MLFADDTLICSGCREQVEEGQRGGGASWEGEEDKVNTTDWSDGVVSRRRWMIPSA